MWLNSNRRDDMLPEEKNVDISFISAADLPRYSILPDTVFRTKSALMPCPFSAWNNPVKDNW